MAVPLLGQFDPTFTRYMNETMELYRGVFQTRNRWTIIVDGSARAGIEAVLVSAIRPGDRVLVPVFGRFGHLLAEIAERCRADVRTLDAPWGTVVAPERIEEAVRAWRPRLVAVVHGDTSTTMAQPLEAIGGICRRLDTLLYVDATATLGGMELLADAWQIDAVSAGLQKCLGGPPGAAPVTINNRMAEAVNRRKHVERGIRDPGGDEAAEPRIQSNYFDLPMLMDYWSERRLNHHTEATSMLYAARECARILLEEGLAASQARHRLASEALTAGLSAMDLELFGDQRHRMANVTGVTIPAGVDGETVRGRLLEDFGIEIGTSFGPLRGKIWRIGTMGYACRKQNVLRCLGALEAVLRSVGFAAKSGAGVDAAWAVYRTAERTEGVASA
jgi:(S)-ureidoglycine-glyoxylate aminotransferase